MDCMPEQRHGRAHAGAGAKELLPGQGQTIGVGVVCSP